MIEMLPTSTTRWRDAPLALNLDDDLVRLVKLARKGRERFVEFDWFFSADELRRLRDAVHDWGSAVVGRYRTFDARVLHAINTALGDSGTELVLVEPRNMHDLDARAACEASGDGYRLLGHASVDLVMGYGLAAWSTRPETTARLGAALGRRLADAVSSLGWDLAKLSTDRFSAVRSALYGLPMSRAAGDVAPAGETIDMPVAFDGPFSIAGADGTRSVLDDDVATAAGIYLWTLPVAGRELVWYVGQTTRSFAQRTAEHVACFLSGQYATPDMDSLERGVIGQVKWNPGSGRVRWPQTLPQFLARHDEIAREIARTLAAMRFYLAPLDGDGHVLDRVEGMIGRHFRAHGEDTIRKFFTSGIRLPAHIPGDVLLCLKVTSTSPIAGLPTELVE